jgi:hypothetical protein
MTAGGRHRIRTSLLANRVDEYESVLEFDDLTEQDYGPYLCRPWNGAGFNDNQNLSELEIRLQPKGSDSCSKCNKNYKKIK